MQEEGHQAVLAVKMKAANDGKGKGKGKGPRQTKRKHVEDNEDNEDEDGARGPRQACAQCNKSKKGCTFAMVSLELVVEPLIEIGEPLKGILGALEIVAYHCCWSEEWWSTEESRQELGPVEAEVLVRGVKMYLVL
ncbi:hypothetical protein BU17DRAFT_65232 [Hysterangium stoloniferum]|nr:hypothetical protein BU17DRAFT_65232 [Hysterangium stoloniferum]